MPHDYVDDPEPLSITTRQEGDSRWAANRAVGVKIRELDPSSAVKSTDRSSQFVFVLAVGQPRASSRIGVSAAGRSRRGDRLQFGEVLSCCGRCNRLQEENCETRIGLDHLGQFAISVGDSGRSSCAHNWLKTIECLKHPTETVYL